MTRTDVEIMASIVAIVLLWLCLFGVVMAAEDCAGADPAAEARGGR